MSGYRSLAEAFRSALFISMTNAPVSSAHEEAEQSPGSDPWYQRAFSEAWMDRPAAMRVPAPNSGAARPKPAEIAELRRFLIESWIDDQIGYHRGATARYQRGRARMTRLIIVLFSVTVFIGVLHTFELIGGEFWHGVFIFLAVALPAFGAAITGIRDQRQYRLHEDRSRNTARRLELLKRNMETRMNLAAVQRLAARVQAVTEAERVDWSGVTEFQDLEMVI